MVVMNEIEVIIQAFRNVGKTFGGRSKVLCDAVAKEIDRLVTVQKREREREYTRRVRENDKAKRVGAELPYPEDDIPF
jgi:hypothetical protein